MAFARARKHYRVAQKEREENLVDGFIISRNQLKTVSALGIFLLLFVFLESVVVFLLGRNK
jgi:hypothetical protein